MLRVSNRGCFKGRIIAGRAGIQSKSVIGSVANFPPSAQRSGSKIRREVTNNDSLTATYGLLCRRSLLRVHRGSIKMLTDRSVSSCDPRCKGTFAQSVTESDDEVEQLNHQYAIRGARQV